MSRSHLESLCRAGGFDRIMNRNSESKRIFGEVRDEGDLSLQSPFGIS